MIFEFSRCRDAWGVCELLKELHEVYNNVNIISIAKESSYFWVFYSLGGKKK